ncbi:hypothetical protein K523DRAFT_323996 [Schizophyllum commune Tattone D]|nr:hypothetical protein K523DRAFT_323996 [Schizophyllum commune Tattone D]
MARTFPPCQTFLAIAVASRVLENIQYPHAVILEVDRKRRGDMTGLLQRERDVHPLRGAKAFAASTSVESQGEAAPPLLLGLDIRERISG